MCKKIVAVVIAIMLLFAECVYAREIITDGRFNSYEVDTVPDDWQINDSYGEVLIKEMTVSGKKIKTLVLTDKDGSGQRGVTAMKSFSEERGKVGFETKFYIDNELGGFTLILGGKSGNVLSFTVGSDGAALASDGSGFVRFSGTIKLRNWNTLRVALDKSTGKYEIRLNSEIINNLALNSNNKEGISYIMLKTDLKMPKVIIEYLQVEKGQELDAGLQDIEAPRVAPPSPHAIKGEINVMLNGEYQYFDYKPFEENGRVLLPVRRVYEMFDIKVMWEEATRTAICEKNSVKIKITADNYNAYVNGQEIKLDVAATISENAMYVPIRFIAESLGAEVKWDDLTNTVIINKEAE